MDFVSLVNWLTIQLIKAAFRKQDFANSPNTFPPCNIAVGQTLLFSNAVIVCQALCSEKIEILEF